MGSHDHNIKYLIIHCSDTADDRDLSARDIHKMHLTFGWDGIGYHKIIRRDGLIENGRPEYWVGAHVYGKNNQSLGVCLIGRNNFSNQQFLSLEKIVRQWRISYPHALIIGHRDATITDKTCPNFNVDEWCKERELNNDFPSSNN